MRTKMRLSHFSAGLETTTGMTWMTWMTWKTSVIHKKAKQKPKCSSPVADSTDQQIIQMWKGERESESLSLCTLSLSWNAHCVYLIYRHLTPMRRRDRTSIKVQLLAPHSSVDYPLLSLSLCPLQPSILPEVFAKCVCIMLNTCPCRRRQQQQHTVAAAAAAP